MISQTKELKFEMNAFLTIYEFKIAGIIPAYHTEIAIGELSFGYSDEGIEIDQEFNMNGLYGYRLITSIPLGETTRTQDQLREIIRQLETEWTPETYDIFIRNCRHFSLALINELECDSADEARRILAGLIYFSEKIGWIISIMMTGLVHHMPINPLTLVSRPLEMFNEGRILDMEFDFKIQLLRMLIMANGLWIVFLLIMSCFTISDYGENEMIERFGNMEL